MNPSMDQLILKNYSTNALMHELQCAPDDIRIIRQVQLCAVKKSLDQLPHQLHGIATAKWQAIASRVRVPHLKLVNSIISPTDGFKKYIFEGEKSGRFETVRIPILHVAGDEKYIICVSSQVGCAAGCVFCATGRMGFKRSLETWEIIDQILKVQADSEYPVRGVVFMGMGEPFLNYQNVMEATKIISDPCGLSIDSKAVTISTVGVVPMIKRFIQEGHRQRLIVSLTSAINEKRNKLLPMNLNYPVESIVSALKTYQSVKKRRVTFAWTMISGVNMDRDEAKALAKATEGLDILLDLIPVNDNTGQFAPPSDDEYRNFLKILNEEVKCPVVRRYSGGADVSAACGMLEAGFHKSPNILKT